MTSPATPDNQSNSGVASWKADDSDKSNSKQVAESKETAEVNIADLQRMSMTDLFEIAEREKITEFNGLKKQI